MRPALRRASLLAAAGAVALALVGVSPAPAAAPAKSATVSINDFYFGPTAVTIKKGGSVKWVWSDANTYPHDVHLKSGPAGLKQKGSYSTKTSAVTDARFQRSFPTPGTYKFICTIHPQMKMTVTVTK